MPKRTFKRAQFLLKVSPCPSRAGHRNKTFRSMTNTNQLHFDRQPTPTNYILIDNQHRPTTFWSTTNTDQLHFDRQPTPTNYILIDNQYRPTTFWSTTNTDQLHFDRQPTPTIYNQDPTTDTCTAISNHATKKPTTPTLQLATCAYNQHTASRNQA